MLTRVLLCVLALCGARVSLAASSRVSSLAELSAAIAQAGPGDTITLANGTYSSGGAIDVSRAGTEQAPITITAETVGGATITDSPAFHVTGSAAFVAIRGFRFNTSGELTMDLGSRNCLITRNLFELGNASRAIHIQGNDHEISYNAFQNKDGAGAIISIDAPSRSHAGTQRPYIHHNLFFNHTFNGSNGGECLVTWGGFMRLEYNLFEQCNGDPEIVSLKASDATVRYNTFRNSTRGQLVFRFTRRDAVVGNFLLGIKGMRIYGDGHKILNNYFENNGTAMMVSHGAADGTYLQIDGLVIAHNTIVGDAITGRAGDLAPQNVTIANNILQKPLGTFVTEGAGWAGTKYEGNILFGGATPGDIAASGFRMVDPQLTRDASGSYHLAAGSPAVNAGVGSYGVTDDIDGQPRSGAADVGADEYSTGAVTRGPLGRNDVGPMATGAPPAPSPDGGVSPDARAADAAAADAPRERAPDTVGDAGGTPGAGGSSGTGGGSGTGGTSGTGGSGGEPDTGGAPPPVSGPSSGCGCRLTSGPGAPAIWVIPVLALLRRARRR